MENQGAPGFKPPISGLAAIAPVAVVQVLTRQKEEKMSTSQVIRSNVELYSGPFYYCGCGKLIVRFYVFT